MKLQEAVKKETMAVAAGTGIGCALLILLFFVFSLVFPESSVKFDYRVVLGAVCGGAVAVWNFFLMALTVQNVVNVGSEEKAMRIMRVSYRNRMMMRAVWILIAIFAPIFNYAAGILPLFIPSLVIKLRGIQLGIGKGGAAQGAEDSGAEETSGADGEAGPAAAKGESDAEGSADLAADP